MCLDSERTPEFWSCLFGNPPSRLKACVYRHFDVIVALASLMLSSKAIYTISKFFPAFSMSQRKFFSLFETDQLEKLSSVRLLFHQIVCVVGEFKHRHSHWWNTIWGYHQFHVESYRVCLMAPVTIAHRKISGLFQKSLWNLAFNGIAFTASFNSS